MRDDGNHVRHRWNFLAELEHFDPRQDAVECQDVCVLKNPKGRVFIPTLVRVTLQITNEMCEGNTHDTCSSSPAGNLISRAIKRARKRAIYAKMNM